MASTKLRTALSIGFFAIVFITIGWLSPALYAANAPADHYVEEHSFTAWNASTEQSEHTACFNRTIHERSVGTVITELYLIDEDGHRIEVQSQSRYRVFQTGQRTVKIDTSLPNELKAGEYRYERVYRMNLAQGRVIRTFIFQSDSFYVKNDTQFTKQTQCNRNI